MRRDGGSRRAAPAAWAAGPRAPGPTRTAAPRDAGEAPAATVASPQANSANSVRRSVAPPQRLKACRRESSATRRHAGGRAPQDLRTQRAIQARASRPEFYAVQAPGGGTPPSRTPFRVTPVRVTPAAWSERLPGNSIHPASSALQPPEERPPCPDFSAGPQSSPSCPLRRWRSAAAANPPRKRPPRRCARHGLKSPRRSTSSNTSRSRRALLTEAKTSIEAIGKSVTKIKEAEPNLEPAVKEQVEAGTKSFQGGARLDRGQPRLGRQSRQHRVRAGERRTRP